MRPLLASRLVAKPRKAGPVQRSFVLRWRWRVGGLPGRGQPQVVRVFGLKSHQALTWQAAQRGWRAWQM